MWDIPVLEVDNEIKTAMNTLAERNSDDLHLLRVLPPEDGSGGMESAGQMLKAVHFLDLNRRMMLFESNDSPACGMEMWYDDNVVKFMFYSPSDEIEKEYRQQISGYYDGCEIADQTPNEGMFIPSGVGDGDYEAVAVSDMHLSKHHYIPIASPTSSSDDDDISDEDPYQRIINEIDTKDDTRVMIQYLYRPAPYDWTEHQSDTIETKAKKIQEKGGFKTKWFGLKVEDVDDAGIYESTASEMRARINKKSYFVNLRIAVVCSGQSQEEANRKAKSRSNALVNTMQGLYETRIGQKFVPRKYTVNTERNAKETLINMIKREPVGMSDSSHFSKYVWQKITPNHSKIILTAEELAGLVHLPSQDDVSSGAVEWTSEMVDGSPPPDVDDFEPVPEEDQDPVDDDYDLTPEDEVESSDDENKDKPSALFDNG